MSSIASHRWIAVWFVGYGVLMGASAAIFEITRPVVMRHHFDRHYGLANGIIAAGSAVGFALFPPGAELLLNWGTPENATEDQKREVRTSHLFVLMLFVVAGYLLHLPCIFLWTDGRSYLKMPRCLSSICKSDSHATRNSESTPNQQSAKRSFSLIKLFKWRLFLNKDLDVIIIAHTIAFFSEFAADNYFYDITYKHHPNFASWTIV